MKRLFVEVFDRIDRLSDYNKGLILVAILIFLAFIIAKSWPSSAYALAGFTLSIFLIVSSRRINPTELEKGRIYVLRLILSRLLHKLGIVIIFVSIGISLVSLLQLGLYTASEQGWYNSDWRHNSKIESAETRLHYVYINLIDITNSSYLFISTVLIVFLSLLFPLSNYLNRYLLIKSSLANITLILMGIVSFTFFSTDLLEGRYSRLIADLKDIYLSQKENSENLKKKIVTAAVISRKLEILTETERLEFGNLLRVVVGPKGTYQNKYQLQQRLVETGPRFKLSSEVQHQSYELTMPQAAPENWSSIADLETLGKSEASTAKRLEAVRKVAVESLSVAINNLFPDLSSRDLGVLVSNLIDDLSKAIIDIAPPIQTTTFENAKSTFEKTKKSVRNSSSEVLKSIENWAWTSEALTGQKAATVSAADAAMAGLAARMLERQRQAAAARAKIRSSLPWYKRLFSFRFRWPKVKIRP